LVVIYIFKYFGFPYKYETLHFFGTRRFKRYTNRELVKNTQLRKEILLKLKFEGLGIIIVSILVQVYRPAGIGGSAVIRARHHRARPDFWFYNFWGHFNGNRAVPLDKKTGAAIVTKMGLTGSPGGIAAG